MKKTFAVTLVIFLFVMTSFGQTLVSTSIDTKEVNGWVPVAWSDDVTEFSSCIVDNASGFSVYPYPRSTKAQMFCLKGEYNSWVEVEKTFDEEYTTLPIVRFDMFAPPGVNGNTFAQMLVTPIFVTDSGSFSALNAVVDLWDRYWTPWLIPLGEEYRGKKFKKARIRFMLHNRDSGAVYIDNASLSRGSDPEPLFDKMGEDFVVGVEDEVEVPSSFSLSQNYPNPFNPTTSIKYSVSGFTNVNLTVYNVLGQEVKTFVNEEKSPGEYTITFDGSNLSSGTYFYRLSTENSVETKKMQLLK